VLAARPPARPQRAVPLLEQAVADTERTLGDEDQVTMAFRSNLAAVYQDTGEVRLAIRLHEQVLAGQERVLGAEHPQTLNSASNLAQDLEQLGDHHAADALRTEVKHRRSGPGEAAPDIGP
jgi:Tetratricopeptide repeat